MRFLVCFLLCISSALLSAPSAVTYDFSGGRFGDCLVSYCHAKWIAYTYKIPLLYKPFDYSDQLMMHFLEIPYSKELEQQFTKVVSYCQVNGKIDPESGYLYVVPFFPESIFNRHDTVFPYLFTVDWHDAGFKSELQKMICPIKQTKRPELPAHCMTVAVHVRKGTGWDIPVYRITPDQLTASHPLRFAPDSFFIDQLKKLPQMFPDTNFYVYLFTDHNNPAELAQKYKHAVGCDQMTIDYRTEENNEFINVLDDFFALTQFDCLIRADSNFSIIASKLGNYKMLISPWHGTVTGQETIIDEIRVEIDGVSFIR